MQIERDAFYAMLGIAMRAGQLSLGESGVLKAISSGAALFMILDAGASDNTKKKFRDSCAFYQVPLYETTPDRLGSAIGKVTLKNTRNGPAPESRAASSRSEGTVRSAVAT